MREFLLSPPHCPAVPPSTQASPYGNFCRSLSQILRLHCRHLGRLHPCRHRSGLAARRSNPAPNSIRNTHSTPENPRSPEQLLLDLPRFHPTGYSGSAGRLLHQSRRKFPNCCMGRPADQCGSAHCLCVLRWLSFSSRCSTLWQPPPRTLATSGR